MKKALIIFAHPTRGQSKANRLIMDSLKGMENLTVRDIYELYPYFDLDPIPEKKLLLEHDLIVFQHPFYWYSVPPLLKLWFDEVLEFGFAYGPQGNALKGKSMLVSVTTGSPEAMYKTGGHHGFEMATFLAPIKQTAALCGMNFLEPHICYGSGQKTDAELIEHGKRLRTMIHES